MKLKFLSILSSLLMAVLAFSSCLHRHDGDVEYPSNSSITAFSINDITSQYTRKINGKDSTYTETLTGSDYPFAIDQMNRTIHNVDSLPYGTDVSKVVVEITADTDYLIYIKAGKDTTWTSTDSLDFSNPVVFKVVAYNMSIGEPYQVSINVHQVDPNLLVWKSLESNFEGNKIGRQKAVTLNQQLFVFAEGDEQALITSTDINDGKSWTELQPLNIKEKADYSTVMVWNNALYILAEGKTYVSVDGKEWNVIEDMPVLSQLVANYETDSGRLMVALNEEGTKFVETSDGITWAETTAVPSGFPKSDISFVSYPLYSNEDIQRMLVVGKGTNALYNMSWTRLSTESVWGDNVPGSIGNACPKLNEQAVIRYNDNLYTFGGDGRLGYTEISAFNRFYQSKDQGIHWAVVKEDIFFPDEFKNCYSLADGHYSYVIDENQYLWIIWSNTNIVWKGRINKLAFN